MYTHYVRGDPARWVPAIGLAQAFIAGPLRHHLVTWPRHGRLGVPADLDSRALCEALPRVIEAHGEFGLLHAGRTGEARLLVLPVGDEPSIQAWCYGAWPGIDVWDAFVEPHLPHGIGLLQTRWNIMPLQRRRRLVPASPPLGVPPKRPALKA